MRKLTTIAIPLGVFISTPAFAQPEQPPPTESPDAPAEEGAEEEAAPVEAAGPAAEAEPVPESSPPAASPDAPPPADDNASKIHLTPQTTSIDGPRTFHMHDGFYLRANFGYGSLWGSYETDTTDFDASGSGIGFDVLVGGSPSPGFVIGGGIISTLLFSADFDPNAADSDITTGMVGVFVDGFPQVTGGWHLGGLIGVGGQTLSEDDVVDKAGGFGGAVWGGYDQWVGDDFSVGGLLRFSAMRSTGEANAGNDVTAATGTLSLMFTALYH